MAKIIAVETSMFEKGNSNELMDEFLKYYKKENPEDEIEIWNLNKMEMAQINMSSKNMDTYWNEEHSDKFINQLKAADKFIISSPMTNFNYTASTKNFLDHILVANKTFSYKYSKNGGSVGLLTNLKAQILTTQGAPLGWYPFGDHTINLIGTLKFMGMDVVKPVTVAGVKISKNVNKTPSEMIAPYLKEIKKAAEAF